MSENIIADLTTLTEEVNTIGGEINQLDNRLTPIGSIIDGLLPKSVSFSSGEKKDLITINTAGTYLIVINITSTTDYCIFKDDEIIADISCTGGVVLVEVTLPTTYKIYCNGAATSSSRTFVHAVRLK